EVLAHPMNPADTLLWRELEPLLDEAMLTLSARQRELVLIRFFQNKSQRAAAVLVGCSETVVSRELAKAVLQLRKFVSRRGVAVSEAALAGLLTAYGSQASMAGATIAASLSAASAAASACAASAPLFLMLMKTTTTTKLVVAGAAALLLASGGV